MKASNCEIYYRSDLKDYGATEDGARFIGEVYYVVAEDDHGNRWQHNRQVDGVKVYSHEDNICFEDVREEAKELCENLISCIKSTDHINLSYWNELPPVYGSKAYTTFEHTQRFT